MSQPATEVTYTNEATFELKGVTDFLENTKIPEKKSLTVFAYFLTAEKD